MTAADPDRRGEPAAGEPHTVALAAGWSVWRRFRIKSAGFPAALPLRLAGEEAAAALDRLLDSEDAERAARRSALDALDRLLEESGADPSVRRVRRRIARGKQPGAVAGDAASAVRPVTQAEQQRAAARRDATDRVSAQLRSQSRTLRDIAGADPRFREALVWQNRRALHSGVAALLRRPVDATDARTRKKERMVASYLQRFCVKNDTIGFFGPTGWGSIHESPDVVQVRPGPELVGHRDVFFEHWAIVAVADALAADTDLRVWAAPRLSPSARLDGHRLIRAGAAPAELPAVVADVVERCDGVTTAQAVAAALVADAETEIESEEEVYDLLAELAQRRVVTWTFEIPSSVSHPEAVLREQLEAIEDSAARDTGCGALAKLDEHRGALRRASGDPETLDAAMAGLENTFRELTGGSPVRGEGETYAARTLVYEDTRRDLSVRLGDGWLARLAPGLAPVLWSARWFTYRIAARMRDAIDRIHRELSAGDGAPIEYAQFWHAVAELFPVAARDRAPVVREVVAELQAGWASALGLDPNARRLEIPAGDLLDRIARAFPAPHPGWPTARHVSPDVLIAAAGPRAFAAGAFQPVLGEVHIGNTLMPLCALQMSEDPDELVRDRDRDITRLCVAPVEAQGQSTRADHICRSPRDLHLELGPSRSFRPRDRVLRAADLAVERRGGLLEVVDRPSGRRFDVIAFLEQYLTFCAAGHFQIAPADRHVPRVTAGDVVICRESWRFEPDDIPVARERDRFERFAAARRFARDHALPRWVFVKIPEETKPVFIDFDSPVYVDLFASLVRKATGVRITEMVPGISEAWLPDAGGRLYTSELRLVAVDPEPWRPPET